MLTVFQLQYIRLIVWHAHRVILCLPYEEDQQIYELLMRSYFPRTLSEENDQQEMLLADNGNAWGELVRAERYVGSVPFYG